MLNPGRLDTLLHALGAWLLALLWLLPLGFALWSAFHPGAYSSRFELTAPLTLGNFSAAWAAAPFPRYFLNTFALVSAILVGQLVLCTLAGYAFARFRFPGRDIAFGLQQGWRAGPADAARSSERWSGRWTSPVRTRNPRPAHWTGHSRGTAAAPSVRPRASGA